MKRRSRKSTKRPNRRRSRSPKRRISRRKNKFRRFSRSKNQFRKHRHSVKKTNLRKVLGITGVAGLIGAGLAVKNTNVDYGQNVMYEENILIPNDKFNKTIKFDDRVDFAVRSKFNGKKETNTYNLYTTYKIEILRDKQRISNLTSSNLPTVTNTSVLPNYFIVNAQLIPLGGIEYSFVFYYQIKPDTVSVATALENKDTSIDPSLVHIVPAVKLLTKFVTDYQNYRDRFKGISSIVDATSLGLGLLGKGVIYAGNKPEGRGSVLNKTAQQFKSSDSKIFEIDIDINKFKTNAIDVSKIPEYYDKTSELKIDIGFVIEGGQSNYDKKHKTKTRVQLDDDLPEVLLGGTHLYGFEIVSQSTDPEIFMTKDKNKTDEMKAFIEPVSIIKEEYYENNYILPIINDLKTKKYQPEQELILPVIKKDERTNNRQFFLYARYFYYRNLHNPAFELKTNEISYSAGNKYIARGTCFGNDRVFNFYQCTNGFIKTYRFGFAIKNSFDKFDFTNIVVEKINELKSFFEKYIYKSKKLICISLLTPCNTSVCKLIENKSKMLPKEAYFNFMENKIIDAENKAFNELGDVFINVPLSANKLLGNLFIRGSKSVVAQNSSNYNITTEFEELIKIKNGRETFETIVNITRLYHSKYKDSHTLCYHCKSGKDRTSLCDAVVQATIYYIIKKGYLENPTEAMYNEIKELSRYFLLYGFIITFYSTGIPGIKLNNIPVAKYILGDKNGNKGLLYNFFLGNSRLSSS